MAYQKQTIDVSSKPSLGLHFYSLEARRSTHHPDFPQLQLGRARGARLRVRLGCPPLFHLEPGSNAANRLETANHPVEGAAGAAEWRYAGRHRSCSRPFEGRNPARSVASLGGVERAQAVGGVEFPTGVAVAGARGRDAAEPTANR